MTVICKKIYIMQKIILLIWRGSEIPWLRPTFQFSKSKKTIKISLTCLHWHIDLIERENNAISSQLLHLRTIFSKNLNTKDDIWLIISIGFVVLENFTSVKIRKRTAANIRTITRGRSGQPYFRRTNDNERKSFMPRLNHLIIISADVWLFLTHWKFFQLFWINYFD